MSDPVQLVFFGEVLSGHAPEVVRQRLGEALRVDGERLTALFSGTRRVLKRSVAPADAQRWVEKVARMGARLHVEPAGGAGPEAAAERSLRSRPASSPESATAAAAAHTAIHAPVQTTAPTPALRLVDKDPHTTSPAASEPAPAAAAALPASANQAAAPATPVSDPEARAQRLAAARERRAQQGQVSTAESGPGVFGLGMQGRMGRQRYATANLWMFTLSLLMVTVVLNRPSVVRVLMVAPFFLLVLFQQMRLSVLRCHDCDKSGWWTMLSFVPSVNAILALVLSFAPGTDGENDYGEPPEPDGWGRFTVAAVALVLSVFVLAFNALHSVRRFAAASPASAPAAEERFEFDARANELPSQEARQAFLGDYANAVGQKAFAVSPSGAFGWAYHPNNAREAVKQALAVCELHRAAYSARCELVHVNGRWVAAGGRQTP